VESCVLAAKYDQKGQPDISRRLSDHLRKQLFRHWRWMWPILERSPSSGSSFGRRPAQAVDQAGDASEDPQRLSPVAPSRLGKSPHASPIDQNSLWKSLAPSAQICSSLDASWAVKPCAAAS